MGISCETKRRPLKNIRYTLGIYFLIFFLNVHKIRNTVMNGITGFKKAN